MDIRRRVPRLPMHFEFKKNPKTIVQQTKPIVQSSILEPSSIVVPSSILVPSSESVPSPANIEEQVKLHQQIVAEWDRKMELMWINDLEMRRADVVRELNTLIAIWNNANP